MIQKLVKIIVFAVCASLCLCGCQTEEHISRKETESIGSSVSAKEPAEKALFAMDTYMTLKAYGEQAEEALEAAAAEIRAIEEMLSTGIETSEISQLNQKGSAKVSETTGYLIERSITLYQMTGGVFDISIYPVMRSWGFTDQNYRIPEKSELTALLKKVQANQIKYEKQTREVTFAESGIEIDLGGIAKGYTADRVIQILKEYDVGSAVISLGGNVKTLNRKPDGSDWKIAVEDPKNSGNFVGILTTHDKAVVTSGGYERYFEQDGERYHHIIDPSSGYPARSGLASVTIVSEDGTLADGLSTSLFILGKEKATKFWEQHSDQFDAVLVEDDGTVWVTEGIADSFVSDTDWKRIEP